MNLKTVAVGVPVLWLAFMATFEPWGLSEAMSLAVWGLALLAASAGVRGLSREAVTAGRVEKPGPFVTGPVTQAQA
jgi:hypothetical protein